MCETVVGFHSLEEEARGSISSGDTVNLELQAFWDDDRFAYVAGPLTRQ